MLTVTVPNGVGAGGQFQANTLSGPMLVTVPPGVRPGDTLQINTAAPATGLTPMRVMRQVARATHTSGLKFGEASGNTLTCTCKFTRAAPSSL